MKSNTLKYSVLDLATVTGGDTFTQTFEKSIRAIRETEKFGYERYWFSEHHNMPSVISAATTLLICRAAAATKTIRVGSGGMMLPNHTTLSVAEQFGTLDAMFPNRIDLGLGRAPGTDPLTASILRRGANPYTYNFEEHIEELFRYFSVDNAVSNVRALPGEGANVPIYILGSSTDSATLAARLGLPYAFAGHFAPAQFRTAFEIYQTQFEPSKHLKLPYSILCLNVFAADTEKEANYQALPHFQAFVNIITGNRAPLCPPENVDLRDMSPQLETKLYDMTALTMIGNKKILKDKLGSISSDLHLNEIMVYTNIYDFDAKLKSYKITSEVFDELNEK